MMRLKKGMYQFGDVHDIFVGTLHQAVLQPWYHLKKKFEYPMLSKLPIIGQRVSNLHQTWRREVVLMRERIFWLLCKFPHAQYAII